MIPTLLWRCPICAVNDALVHTTRWPLRDRVDCTHCHARWLVSRKVGENFYLKLVSTKSPVERSISAWYDEMKKTIRLETISNPAIVLDARESLYLISMPAELWTESPDLDVDQEVEEIGVFAGYGHLFLTDKRLCWQGLDGIRQDFPLQAVSGVYAILTLGIAVTIGLEMVFFRLPNESPLKWVTYSALLATQIEAAVGHKLVTSHY